MSSPIVSGFVEPPSLTSSPNRLNSPRIGRCVAISSLFALYVTFSRVSKRTKNLQQHLESITEFLPTQPFCQMKQSNSANTWSLLTQVLNVDGEEFTYKVCLSRQRVFEIEIIDRSQADISSDHVLNLLRAVLRYPWRSVCDALDVYHHII